MKIFEKFMRSNKLNNRRLFYLLSVFALFGIVSLFIWQPSAEMQDKNESEWRIQNIKGDIPPNDDVPATRIPSITVSTNMGSGFGTNIQNTVNGVGLSSLSLTATHAATIPPNSWVSATGQLTGTVTFNLGGIFTVDSFSFWNQNGGGPGANGSTGIQGVAVSTSTDGITFTPLSGGPTSFAQVTANANVPPQIFNFTPVSAGFFRFTILSNYGDPAQTGFAEVGFNAVTGTPTPTPTATPTPTPRTCIFANGDFETNSFAGWTVFNQAGGSGSWFTYTGNTSPLSNLTISSPPEGRFAAVTDQTGPGTHILYRDVTVPAGTSSLSFFLYYINRSSSFVAPPTLDYTVNPNQQYRVDVMRTSAPIMSVASGDVLANLFITNPGAPLTLAPTLMN